MLVSLQAAPFILLLRAARLPQQVHVLVHDVVQQLVTSADRLMSLQCSHKFYGRHTALGTELC